MTVFLVSVIAGAMLVVAHRNRIDQYYAELVPKIERSIIIGAGALLFWPLTDAAANYSDPVINRDWNFEFRASMIVPFWCLFLVFYLSRRLGRQGEMLWKVAGLVFLTAVIILYSDIASWVTRVFGAGMGPGTLATCVVIAVAGMLLLLWRRAGRYA
jgi:hypothetical protein